MKQVLSCVFAGSFLLLLAISKHVAIPGLQRYDFLFLAAIVIQLMLVMARLETWREVAVLSLFHLIGVGLELFKTSAMIGAWSYPEPAFFRLGTVPLYSGFMYASVASYMMQSWRVFDMRITGFPALSTAIGLSVAIYANFFTHHYVPDFRWLLAAAVVAVCYKSRVHFTITRYERSMPVALSFALIGFFIWIAENIATFFGAWVYPNQTQHWAVVHPNKISSWMLLVMISFIIVASLKQIFPKQQAERSSRREPRVRPARVRLVRMEMDREDESPIRVYLR